MTVQNETAPQTSNQKNTIPTQKSPPLSFDKGFLTPVDGEGSNATRELAVVAVRARYETENRIYPGSLRMLREVFVQVGIAYPQDQETVAAMLTAFTEKAVVAYDAYQSEVADQTAASGRNLVKANEIMELVEPIDVPFMRAMGALTVDQWVQSHPLNIKPDAIEAYMVASLMTLNANNITPGFMMEPHEEIHE